MDIEIITAGTVEHEAMLQLIEIQKALSVIKSPSRRTRTIRNYKLMTRRGEKVMTPSIRRWMNETIKEIQRNLPKMRGRDAERITENLADWEAINLRGQELMKPAYLEVLTMGGNTVVGNRILKQERFDPIGVEAVKWVTEHSAELVVAITEETMIAIRNVIKAGIDAGKTLPQIAKELRPVVGLTPQYADAVNTFAMKLTEAGIAEAEVTRKAERYAARLHRRRTETISRTETAFALTEGQRQGYEQIGVTRLERVEDPDAPDDDCQENNGRIYTLAEAQGVLPAHPNCGGTWVAA